MTEFATLRAKAAALFSGGAIDPTNPVFTAPLRRLDDFANAIRESMDQTPNRPSLWPDLPLKGVSGDIASSYQRLRALAVAWATPGAASHGDEKLSIEILTGLDFLYERAYNETKREVGNWWHWEIGSPRALMDTCVLMHDVISADQRTAWLRAVDKFCPNPDRRTTFTTLSETGANRADKALIVALRGMVGDDAAKLALARDGLSDLRDSGRHSLFTQVTKGDGLYADGSFIQHDTVAYTGSYGVVLLSAVSSILGLLSGSEWEVTNPGRAIMFDAVDRTFAPWIHDGLMMDSVRGRAVSRQFTRDHDIGRDTVDAVLQLAEGAPAPYANRFKELAKGWIERGRFLDGAGVPATARATAVLSDQALASAPRPIAHHVFADMDRVVHRRTNWSFALSLASKRISVYECGNGENYRAWYQGDGATYLYTDLDHYSSDYWPTVNSYRLAGTTVDTRPRDRAVSVSGTGTFGPKNAWAGGAVLGEYGVAGLDLMGMDVTLTAKKTWIFLDNAVVCLGAGITSTDARTIETIVENRTTTGELLVEDGWAHLEGVGGYVFPGDSPIQTLRESRSSTWREIDDGPDTGGTADPVTRDYVTLWFDHGANPTNATYAYLVLPTATRQQTHAFSRSTPVTILANTPEVQAVATHNLFAANFWTATTVPSPEPSSSHPQPTTTPHSQSATNPQAPAARASHDPDADRQPLAASAMGTLGTVTADAPCAVLIRRSAGRLSVAVSDPSRTVAQVTLTLGHPAHGLVQADETVTVRPGKNPEITVNLAGSRGHTHTAELSIGDP